MKEQMGVNMGVAALGVGVSRVANAIQQLGLYGPWDKIIFGIIMLRLFFNRFIAKTYRYASDFLSQGRLYG